MNLLARTEAALVRIARSADGTKGLDELKPDPELGGLRMGRLEDVALPAPVSPVTVHLDTNDLENLWFPVQWGGAA